jgi:hypothetical protein
MKDCAPRNVVVDGQSDTPRIVDLAQCRFRDELVKRWYKHGWHEDKGWDPDVEYWEQVGTASNPAAIGAVMVMRIQKMTGVKLDVRYPDYEAIIAGTRRRKAESAAAKKKGAAKVEVKCRMNVNRVSGAAVPTTGSQSGSDEWMDGFYCTRRH